MWNNNAGHRQKSYWLSSREETHTRRHLLRAPWWWLPHKSERPPRRESIQRINQSGVQVWRGVRHAAGGQGCSILRGHIYPDWFTEWQRRHRCFCITDSHHCHHHCAARSAPPDDTLKVCGLDRSLRSPQSLAMMGAWLNLRFAATDTLPRSLASILLPVKSELPQSWIWDVFDIRSAALNSIHTTANDSKERERLLLFTAYRNKRLHDDANRPPYSLTVLKNGLKCFEFWFLVWKSSRVPEGPHTLSVMQVNSFKLCNSDTSTPLCWYQFWCDFTNKWSNF